MGVCVHKEGGGGCGEGTGREWQGLAGEGDCGMGGDGGDGGLLGEGVDGSKGQSAENSGRYLVSSTPYLRCKAVHSTYIRSTSSMIHQLRPRA